MKIGRTSIEIAVGGAADVVAVAGSAVGTIAVDAIASATKVATWAEAGRRRQCLWMGDSEWRMEYNFFGVYHQWAAVMAAVAPQKMRYCLVDTSRDYCSAGSRSTDSMPMCLWLRHLIGTLAQRLPVAVARSTTGNRCLPAAEAVGGAAAVDACLG